METFIHLKENTPLKFDVILFQVAVLRCKLVILKKASTNTLKYPTEKWRLFSRLYDYKELL